MKLQGYLETILRKNFKSESCLNRDISEKILPITNMMKSAYSMDNTRDSCYLDNLSEDSREDQESDEDVINSSLRKKTLKDYDRDLKCLKEENFDLKLRIYMLEEKLAETESTKLGSQLQSVIKNKLYVSESEDDSESEQDLTHELMSSKKSGNVVQSLPGTKYFDQINYDSDSNHNEKGDFQKGEAEDSESLKERLKMKEAELEASLNRYKELEEKFEQFKRDYDAGIQQLLKDKYEKHLNKALNEKNMESLQREKDYKEKVHDYEKQLIKLNENIQNKDIENASLQKKYDELKDKYKFELESQKKDFIEKQMGNENRIKDLEESLEICQKQVNTVRENILKTEKENDSILNPLKKNQNQQTLTLIDDDYKDVTSSQLTNSAKNYYQVIIYELENQLGLKENLIQQYIVAIRTRDAQINRLTCNPETTEHEHKLKAYIVELKNALSTKDTLYSKTLQEHFSLIEQKDSLILNLRYNWNKTSEELTRVNNLIALQSKEIQSVKKVNEELLHQNHSDVNNYNFLMEKYNNKHDKVLKMKENFRKLKEKYQLQSDESDLTRFSDEQMSDESFLVNRSTDKIVTNTYISNEDALRDRIQNYKIEIVNLTQKIKEKDCTIKNLIASADEKDSTIARLQYLAECKNTEVSSSEFSKKNSLTMEESCMNRIEVQRRKIDGLLKLIQEKNQTIDNLKCELNDLKNTSNNVEETNDNIKTTLDYLEKEIQVYINLNAKKQNVSVNNQLADIKKLRNSLIQKIIAKESSETSMNTSGENLNNLEEACTKSSLISFGSARQRCDSMPDSGVMSDNKTSRCSSIPRPVNGTNTPSPTLVNQSMEDCNIEKLNTQITHLKQELNFKRPKVIEIHNELSNLREKFEKSERLNEYLRKQIEIYHITHGNLDSLLEMAHKLNLTREEMEQYKEKLTKIQQISDSLHNGQNKNNQIYNSSSEYNLSSTPTRHIKVTITTLEAQLEEAKQKYDRLRNLYDNSERACRYLAVKFNKYKPITGDGFERQARNLSRSLSTPDLTITKFKTENYQTEAINVSRIANDLEDSQFLKKLILKYSDISFGAETTKKQLDNVNKNELSRSNDILNLSCMSGLSTFEQNFVSSSINNISLGAHNHRDLELKYTDKLFYIYKCFKSLKANSKYMNSLFGIDLMEIFKKRESNQKDCQILKEENIIQEIFNNAFMKFDEMDKKLDVKDNCITELTTQLSQLKQDREIKGAYSMAKEDDLKRIGHILTKTKMSLDELKNKNTRSYQKIDTEKIISKAIGELEAIEIIIKNSFSVKNVPINLETAQASNEKLKSKVEKYKLEISRLKSKINIQNKDIEEALKQLTETNREKEHLKTYFKDIENEIDCKENNNKRMKFRENEPESKICLKVYKIL